MTAGGSTAQLTTALPFDGRFDLAFAGRFLQSWPAANHAGLSADGALRLAFVTDDLAGVAGVTLRHRAAGELDAEFTGPPTPALVAQVRRILSLDLDAAGFESRGQNDEALARLQARAPGVRPVLFANPYEGAIWAVLSARVPAARAAQLHGELMVDHGGVLDVSGEMRRVLPTPPQLLRLEELVGAPPEKVRRLHAVAQAGYDGVLDPSALLKLSPDEALTALKSIRGIGDFYAQLIYIRALGADLVPASEPRILAAAAQLLGTQAPLTPEEFSALVSGWRPFRGWAAFLLRTT